MKRRLLKSANANIGVAIEILQDIKQEDIKARKKSKAYRKPKWTKSISALTIGITALRVARKVIKDVPKRV